MRGEGEVGEVGGEGEVGGVGREGMVGGWGGGRGTLGVGRRMLINCLGKSSNEYGSVDCQTCPY